MFRLSSSLWGKNRVVLGFCCLFSHLKDLAVLCSRQDAVGSPADAANGQTWRRKMRRKRIRRAVKKKTWRNVWRDTRGAVTKTDKNQNKQALRLKTGRKIWKSRRERREEEERKSKEREEEKVKCDRGERWWKKEENRGTESDRWLLISRCFWLDLQQTSLRFTEIIQIYSQRENSIQSSGYLQTLEPLSEERSKHWEGIFSQNV